jgi:predicted N-acetyltransferase YhbS
MLGPLVVDPEWKGRGVGVALMRASLEEARRQGHPWAILVGDQPYYARVGFARMAPGRIRLPGPVDPDRLLALELEEGSLNGASGLVRAVRWGV